MKTKLLTLLFISILSVTNVMAQSGLSNEKVLTVKNSDENSFFDLYIAKDEEDKAKGLKMYDRGDKEWKDFNIKNLSKGVVLKAEGEHEVIILKSNDFEEDRGGHFKVDYLHNGITGKRQDIDIKFDFDGTNWQVYHRGEKVNLLDFKLKKFFGKTIGIEKVVAK